MAATEKQVNYALYLMRQAEYSTDWMGSEHKALRATMRERSGKVGEWLRGMERDRISALIDQLKVEIGEKTTPSAKDDQR